MLALGFDDHMYMGALLTGVERHGVSVLECEFLAREFPDGRQNFFRWRRGWHRKHDVVDQLRSPSGHASVPWPAILSAR
jgi:hypothetical protein